MYFSSFKEYSNFPTRSVKRGFVFGPFLSTPRDLSIVSFKAPMMLLNLSSGVLNCT